MEQYRKSPRAEFLNYNTGDYFITICTEGRKHYFGEIRNAEMNLSRIGEFVYKQLADAKNFNKAIGVPLFVVMPNHIHAIISIADLMGERDVLVLDSDESADQRNPNPSLRANPTCQRHVPTLSRYISSFKGAVTKFAKSCGVEFKWQSRYYDHYIRGDRDGNNISEYILNNVAKWHEDCFYQNEIQIQNTTISD